MEMQLKDNILNVVSFDASQDKSHVNLRFILDSNGIAKVNGYFNVKTLKRLNSAALSMHWKAAG